MSVSPTITIGYLAVLDVSTAGAAVTAASADLWHGNNLGRAKPTRVPVTHPTNTDRPPDTQE
ncbi:hypothetical protein ATK86_2543 [Nocardia fluminea]|uniref:Uncharacterized protein n=1 Tax=Nocardia fluminea TaxID=134984 RepID=A0A2N3V981_9NOCA|nr:hypothetical protein ATK86_2543 [Nocardia fluminea]